MDNPYNIHVWDDCQICQNLATTIFTKFKKRKDNATEQEKEAYLAVACMFMKHWNDHLEKQEQG